MPSASIVEVITKASTTKTKLETYDPTVAIMVVFLAVLPSTIALYCGLKAAYKVYKKKKYQSTLSDTKNKYDIYDEDDDWHLRATPVGKPIDMPNSKIMGRSSGRTTEAPMAPRKTKKTRIWYLNTK